MMFDPLSINCTIMFDVPLVETPERAISTDVMPPLNADDNEVKSSVIDAPEVLAVPVLVYGNMLVRSCATMLKLEVGVYKLSVIFPDMSVAGFICTECDPLVSSNFRPVLVTRTS